jgi:benzoyl-CoA reductase/2-hydroxyglutaryl-CoA dehydratase subunit BcrC/BadD/HgdB
MINVAYCSPMVPPEWIAAHQMQPVWPRLAAPLGETATAAHRGVCRCAGLLVDHVLDAPQFDAVVLTTSCDQTRYAAALLRHVADLPVFLMNIPSTWQGTAAGRLYRDELDRLGRFLERCGGRRPSAVDLRRVARHYNAARDRLRRNWPSPSHVAYRAQLDALRCGGDVAMVPGASGNARTGVPLALVGGPLLEHDFVILQLVDRAGGQIVLDASEGGERSLPGPLDPEQLERDPLAGLCRAYCDTIPAVFRRPNTALYRWLGRYLDERRVRGILFWWRLSCDLWHAELEPMRVWSPVPLLDVEAIDGGCSAAARTAGRIEAFIEMLQ